MLSFAGYAIFVILERIVYIKLLFYLKVFALISIDRMIKKRLERYELICSIYKFLRLVVDVVLVTNIAGCLFFFVDYDIYLQKGFYWENNFIWLTSTIDADIIQTWSWWVWYEYALSFGVQTTVSCGIGILVARNPP